MSHEFHSFEFHRLTGAADCGSLFRSFDFRRHLSMISRRKLPPLWIFVILFLLLYGSLSAGLTRIFKLPWYVPIPPTVSIVVGIILLAFGFGWMAWALRSLSIRRAFGKELFKSAAESTLVTTGAYAYSRNPVYFSATVLFLGWFFVFRWTPVAIMTVLFLVHFMLVAKWEEKELTQRFGDQYRDYKQRVPFLIPGRKRKSPQF
ncbi:MAG: isoprenylcysteine carboxylmethyltransferase family protein [Planctomycetota bacterium]|nr:isoprenylcysteine carboxylmethyltransferase family protein [Planctomycetota bacterium]